MKFLRIGELGREIPVVENGGDHFDLSGLTVDINGDFWSSGGTQRTRDALAAGELQPIDISGKRQGAPIARPGAIFCIGQNYRAHALETGATPPTTPIVFFKPPNSISGPYDDVLIPRGSRKTDWEVELGVVIGKTASYLESQDDALAHVAGYVTANDVSEREFQLEISGGQWSKGKSAPTFNPVGPYLVPADELLDPQDLRLQTWVNGETRQDSSTSDMIFSVSYLIWNLSQYMTLEPGDLINTGTPQGVATSGKFPYLKEGDVMELEISGLGRQRTVLAQA